MKLTILGMGTPAPSAELFGTSYVLEIGGDTLMFDCGPATTYKMARMDLRPTDVSRLFFTHHHFDHDADYPCFLLARWDLSIGDEPELTVYGPPPTETLTKRLLDPETGAFAHDWLARVNCTLSLNAYRMRGGKLPRHPPHVEARDVGVGEVCTGSTWNVTADKAVHVQPWLESLAYRLESKEGIIVFTGDTCPCPSVIDLARGAGTLVCMCVDHQERLEETGTHIGQSGSTAAARMAQEAGVKRLVLVHQRERFARPGEMERAIGDISKIYSGQVIFPHELMRIEL